MANDPGDASGVHAEAAGMSGRGEERPTVRSLSGGKWHRAFRAVPRGLPVWTLCGLSWPNGNYSLSTVQPVTCKRCEKQERPDG